MAGFGKWLAGGLGLVLGGPMGAIIGFALSSMFEGSSTTSSRQSTHNRPSRNTTEGDFKMSLLVMIACVMKADGSPKKQELDVAKRFLLANFGEDGALEAVELAIALPILASPSWDTLCPSCCCRERSASPSMAG